MRENSDFRRRSTWGETLIERGLFLCGVVSVVTTFGIVAILGYESFHFFRVVRIRDFLFDTQWTPLFSTQRFGIWPLVSGTVLTTVIAVVVALPFGLLAAIYLSEFANERSRRVIKPAIEILAGVPTIVYGYFALVFVTPLLQKFVPNLAGFNSLSPGIVMGVMIIPLISSLSEDALYSVPMSLREGAYALGAGKLPTIFRVVIPAALSGIAAAVTLAVSRAVGETMIMAIAAGQQPRLTLDPRVQIETMTAYIVQVALGDTPHGSLAYQTIFVVGACLFLMTLGMNMLSQRLARRYRRKN